MSALTGTDHDDRIGRFLAASALVGPQATVVALTGDASDRRYVRVHDRSGHSLVLAVHPGPIAYDAMPFASVWGLLRAMPVPVPDVLAHDDALGIIALEDLGDLTLQARLATASPDERAALYDRAVQLIATLQQRGAALASTGATPYGLAFDEEKLGWELAFFRTHFLAAHRGIQLEARASEVLTEACTALAAELAAEPRVLCHRDYHSRNLMVRGSDLVIIDFQDARLGPDTYDLVSLLRDAYVDFDEPEVNRLVARFVSLQEAAATPSADHLQVFRARFDAMTLQRTLKALGTFGFQAASRGNPAYLPYVPRALSIVRATLQGNPRFGALHERLASCLPELR